jgi:hypothetical protein
MPMILIVIVAVTGCDQIEQLPASVTAPLAPSGLVTTAESPTTVVLTWPDNSTNEQGFVIERRSEGESEFTVVHDLGADTTSVDDTAVKAGVTYSYRVRAYNVVGDSAYSNTAEVTTRKVRSSINNPVRMKNLSTASRC